MSVGGYRQPNLSLISEHWLDSSVPSQGVDMRVS